MSATLSNLDILKDWLQAESYHTDYRPVELQEMIKIGRNIYDKNMKLLRELPVKNDLFINDHDNITQLVIETIADNFSILIFCASKDWCEKLSLNLAQSIHNILKKDTLTESQALKNNLNQKLIDELKAQFKHCVAGLDTTLEKILSYGCAYHHSGTVKFTNYIPKLLI